MAKKNNLKRKQPAVGKDKPKPAAKEEEIVPQSDDSESEEVGLRLNFVFNVSPD